MIEKNNNNVYVMRLRFSFDACNFSCDKTIQFQADYTKLEVIETATM